MGTVATELNRTRVKLRDASARILTNDELMEVLNGEIFTVHQELKNIESQLVYSEDTITTEDGTMVYTPSFTHDGFLNEGLWISDERTPLVSGHEADKIAYDYENSTNEPNRYFLQGDGDVGFLWVPDAAYTVRCLYWEPIATYEVSDYDDDNMPFRGIWNKVLRMLTEIEALTRQGRNASTQAVKLETDWGLALQATFRYGVRRRRQKSDFFTVRGV